MKTILTQEACKANDLYTVLNQSITEEDLIQRAAKAVLDTLKADGYNLQSPCILCGSGNNGADGFMLAYLLKKEGVNVTVLYLGALIAPPAPPKKGQPAKQEPSHFDPSLIGTPNTEQMSAQCLLHYKKALSANVTVLTALPENAFAEEAAMYSVFVDAVYGTGMHGAITDQNVCNTFDLINQSSIPVVAVDIPSGAHCDTGALDAHAVCAAQTVTMQDVKAGLLLYPAAEYAGKITVADIGIESEPSYRETAVLTLEDDDIDALLPTRPTRSNKGTFGRVLVIGGGSGMAGAAYLAAMAAYRAGAGIVEILTPSKNRTILQQLLPEAVLTCYADKSKLKKAIKVSLCRADAIVIGCGIGRSKLSDYCVKYTLKKAKVPLVIDADALNVIAQKPAYLKHVNKKQKPQTIITPHPKEAAGLLGKKSGVDQVLSDIATSAQQLCDKYQVNVLLKDARTLICSQDKKIRYINLSGSTALATAGAGDILAGYIGGLCAAKTSEQPIATTAALAAYLHGKAGETAEQKVGARAAMARDILDGLTE